MIKNFLSSVDEVLEGAVGPPVILSLTAFFHDS